MLVTTLRGVEPSMKYRVFWPDPDVADCKNKPPAML